MKSKLKSVNFLIYLGLAVSVASVIIFAKLLNFQELLTNALEWINSLGTFAAIVFILIYLVATVLFFPASLLTLGAGVIFDVIFGSLYVFIGAMIGAVLAFLVGRYVARGWVEKQIEGNQKFKQIDQAVGEEGVKIVLLTRLSPVFPFNLLNYAYGLTKVSLKDYTIGTLGILPGTIMFVYVGSLAKSLATLGSEQVEAPSEIQWAIRIIGFIATVAVTVYVTKIATKTLNQSVEIEPQDNLPS